MAEFWAWNPFSVGVKKNAHALGDTRKVLSEASRLRAASPLSSYDDVTFAGDVIRQAIGDEDVHPSSAVLYALMDMLSQSYHDEGLSEIKPNALRVRPNSRQALAVREYLRQQIRFLQNYQQNMSQFKKHMSDVARYLMASIPISVLEREAEASFLSTRYSDLIDNLPEAVETIGMASFGDDLQALSLLDLTRKRFEANVMNVSKIDPRLPPVNRHRYIMPTQAKGLSGDDL